MLYVYSLVRPRREVSSYTLLDTYGLGKFNSSRRHTAEFS